MCAALERQAAQEQGSSIRTRASSLLSSSATAEMENTTKRMIYSACLCSDVEHCQLQLENR